MSNFIRIHPLQTSNSINNVVRIDSIYYSLIRISSLKYIDSHNNMKDRIHPHRQSTHRTLTVNIKSLA